MHPMQLAERLKNLSDGALQHEMQSEPGSAPKYVVMAEMERRKGIRGMAQGGVVHFQAGSRGQPVEWKHQEQYGPPADYSQYLPPGPDIETVRALRAKKKRPWYQMGPENTFLTPERTKAAAAAYHSQPWITFNGQAQPPGDPTALRERGAGYDAAIAAPATPNQPAPARPVGIAAARTARPAGPAAPPISDSPYPETAGMRYPGPEGQGVTVDPALADAAGQETGGYGATSAGLGALLTSTTAPGKRPGSFEEYMKQAEDANPDGLAGMREKYMAMMDEQKTSKDQMGWNAMLKAGIGMMNTKSSRFLGAAGEGAAAAFAQYEHDLRGNKDTDKARLAAEMDFAKYGATRSANINKTARELRRQDIDDDRYNETFAYNLRRAGVADRAEGAKASYYQALSDNARKALEQKAPLVQAQTDYAKARATSEPQKTAATVARANRVGSGGAGSGASGDPGKLTAPQVALMKEYIKAGMDPDEAYRKVRNAPPPGGATATISWGSITGGKPVPRTAGGQEIKPAF